MPDEEEEDGDGEDGSKDGEPPDGVGQKNKRQGRNQTLQGKTDCRTHADGTINSLIFCFFFTTGIGHEVDNLGGEHFRQGVGCQDSKDGCHGGKGHEDATQKGEVEDEGDDTIGADVGVLHDGQDTLTVGTSSKAIEEVGKSIFVQGSCHEKTHDDGKDDGDGKWQDMAQAEEGGCHDATCEPTCEGPVFNDSGVCFLGGLMKSPERKTGEEDKSGENAAKNIW